MTAEVSFEFFPPAEPRAEVQLQAALQSLASLKPSFVSVTCGANGSTRSRTARCVDRILQDTPLEVAPHLTCAGATRGEIDAQAREYARAGVRHLVVLRGDAPAGAHAADVGANDGYRHASDLVTSLAAFPQFSLTVAAYPEGHPESSGVEADLANLRRKVDAGASRAITQFFFDCDAFLHYRDRCAALQMEVELIPGILPINRFSQLTRFAARCGAHIPSWLHARFNGLEDDLDAHRQAAVNVGIEQIQYLMRHGVSTFHFYTLNRAELTHAICHALELRPEPGMRATRDACAAGSI